MTLHSSPDGVLVRTARNPWGPWSAGATVFDGDRADRHATADNLVPGHRFVGLPHDVENRTTGVYAPYLIAPWTEYDGSTRTLTVFYALSTEHPPYNVQLMTATLRYT